MTSVNNSQARSVLQAVATDMDKRIDAVGQILIVRQLDLHPHSSVNKKLKLSLSKKKGKAISDPENSERFTFIGDTKVVWLEKIFAKNADIYQYQVGSHFGYRVTVQSGAIYTMHKQYELHVQLCLRLLG